MISKRIIKKFSTNPVIEKIYCTGVVEDKDNNQISHNISPVSFDSGIALYNLIQEYKPLKTLEIGFGYGLSTLFICQSLSDNKTGKHVVIDPFEEKYFKCIGLLNIERAGLDKYVTVYQQPSHEVLQKFLNQQLLFDLAFIDGSHLFDYVMVDFFLLDFLLPINGLLIFDDLWMPAIRKVISFIIHNRNYKLFEISKKSIAPYYIKLLRIGRRFLQEPFGKDLKLKCLPSNIAILQKTGHDKRKWDFHRKF